MNIRFFFVFFGLYLSAAVNAAPIQFQDESSSVGLTGYTESWGLSWGDVNGDNWPDLFIQGHRDFPRFYRNNGSGGFDDVAYEYDPNGVWISDTTEDMHGTTLVDVDGDGDDDVLISVSGSGPAQLLLSQAESNGVFLDVAVSAGIDDDGRARMGIWFDYDNDGLLDLLQHSAQGSNLRHHDTGALTFTSGADICPGSGDYGQLADINNDGDLDYICGRQGTFPQEIFDFTGGVFTSISSLMPVAGNVIDSIPGDFNNDLKTDLILPGGALRASGASQTDANGINAWFRGTNNPGFEFTATGEVTFIIDPAPMGIFDDSDVVVLDTNGTTSATPGGVNVSYSGVTGKWTVTKGTPDQAYVRVRAVNPIGNLEVINLTTAEMPSPTLYAVNSSTGFNLVTSVGLDDAINCVSGVAEDFDNDMDLDLYLACRYGTENIANRYYDNQGDGSFVLVASHGGEGPLGTGLEIGVSESVASADYDVDGFMDIAVTNGLLFYPVGRGGPDKLFRNQGNSNHWIEIDLKGVTSNSEGIGAKVFATAGGVTQLREQNGGYHRWSQNDQRIHFGLAANTSVDITINWPSGQTDTFTNVVADKLYEAVEGAGITETTLGGPVVTEFAVDDECGQPAYNNTYGPAILLWRNCGTTEWRIRFRSGIDDDPLVSAGVINGSRNFGFANGVRLSAGDTVDNSQTDIINFDVSVQESIEGNKGINFSTGNQIYSCLSFSTQDILPIIVGSKGKRIKGVFDLLNLDNCDKDNDNLTNDDDDDDDGDGVLDGDDDFPLDPTESVDSDNDGVGDNADAFPNDPNETADSDNDGIGDNADIDADNDGLADTVDTFTSDNDGDGVMNAFDLDSDNDTIPDVIEAGLTDADNNYIVDDLINDQGSVTTPSDSDSDGIPDFLDLESNNPANDGTAFDIANTTNTALDTNSDGMVGVLDTNGGVDADADGIDDLIDSDPSQPGGSVTDSDGDGVPDHLDAFPNDPNESADADNDGIGDNSDIDMDNDGLPNSVESGSSLAIIDWSNATTGVVANGNDLSYDGSNSSSWSVSINSSSMSTYGFTDDYEVSWKLSSDPATSRAAIGLGVSESSNSHNDIDYQLRAHNGDLRVYENGTLVASSLGILSIGSLLSIEVSSAGEIRYKLDGAVVQTTTLTAAIPDFYIDTSFRNGAVTFSDFQVQASGNYFSLDVDGDNVNNAADLDSDNDSIPDVLEAGLTDADGNYLVDDLINDQGTVTTPPDTDGDGIPDYLDLESNNANNDGTAYDIASTINAALDTNGDGMVGDADTNGGVDADADGIDDLIDTDPTQPGGSSNGTPTDSDGDGVPDDMDAFPNDPNETMDTDGDGVGDNADAFPADPNETADTDGDGVGDNADAFPADPNETADTDGDGVGDNGDAFPTDPNEAVDSDGDGVGDNGDVFPNDPNETTDTDGDGVGDNGDAFPTDPNETTDTDGDGVGDNADVFPADPNETMDTDGDGVGDNGDAFPADPNETADTDGDGVGDNADAFPADPNETTDSDNDGIGDNSDIDSDNDGLPDVTESTVSTITDQLLDDFETNQGWVTNPSNSDTATTGQWEVGNPARTSTNGNTMQLNDTVSGLNALVTQAAAGNSVGTYDIDGGVTSVRSPVIVLPATALTLKLNYYFAHLSNADSDDFLRVSILANGNLQTILSELGDGTIRVANWTAFSADISAYAGQSIQLLVEAADAGNPSLIEAAIDDIILSSLTMNSDDADGDGINNEFDLDSDNDSIPDVVEAGLSDVDGNYIVDDLINDQGTVTNPPDTDSDGIPDFLDIESTNVANDGTAFDIDTTANATLDTNNDGRIDSADNSGGVDADSDGIDDLVDPDPTQPGGGTNPTLDSDGDGVVDSEDAYPNDPTRTVPDVSVTDITVMENNGNALIQVELSVAAKKPATVVLDTSDGSAFNGSDYSQVSTTVNFAAGDTSQTVMIPLIDDIDMEPTESFTVTLSNPLELTLTTNVATVTIEDNDNGGVSDACFAPSYSPASEKAVFIWQLCDGSGEWRLRVTAGGDSNGVFYEGYIESLNGLTYSEFSIEAHDTLDTSNPDLLGYILKVWNSAEDGINFVPGANACLVTTAPSLPVYLGENRVLVSSPLDLTTLGACDLVPPATECSEPDYDPATDQAIFIWKDCVTDQWEVRFTAGGDAGGVSISGEVTSSGGFNNLTQFSLEASDTLDNATNTDRLSYQLNVWIAAEDGFGFTPLGADACFAPDNTVPVFLGEGKVSVVGSLNLDTLGSCTIAPDPVECGEPQYNVNTEPGLYLWRDCDASGSQASWFMRAAGGGLAWAPYSGVLTSSNPVSKSGISIEASDTLDAIAGDNNIDFTLNVGNSGMDGIDILIPAGSQTCFDLQRLPTGSQLYLGRDKALKNSAFNLEDLGLCL